VRTSFTCKLPRIPLIASKSLGAAVGPVIIIFYNCLGLFFTASEVLVLASCESGHSPILCSVTRCVDGPGSCPAFFRLSWWWPQDNYNIDYGFGAIPYYMGSNCLLIRYLAEITFRPDFEKAVEHVCSHLRVLRLAILCSIEDKMDGICTFFFNSFPHVYDYISCSLWNGIVIFYINMLCAFGWTYIDLFIILISIALADRFKQINKCLEAVNGKCLSEEFWHQIRMDYNMLSNLTKTVDSCISKLILVSYANNLYSICMQLLNNLHPPENSGQLLYVSLSFGYMIVRIVAVSICAARINEESNRPKTILYSVPDGGYTADVERLLQQVTTDNVVLTGLNFFSVTRTLLVT
ncbi:hypothetical protein L9F63_026020, partial [Diploptera punctata]